MVCWPSCSRRGSLIRLTPTDPLRRSVRKQTSNVTTTYNCFCRLTETIHASLYALYSPVSVITSEVLLRIYTSYLEWYDQMPEALRLGLNSTPSVLFCQ